MKKALKEAYEEAKTLPRGLWLAAIVVPGGIVTLTVYVAGKTAYQNFKKRKK